MATLHAIAVTSRGILGLLEAAVSRAEFPNATFKLLRAADYADGIDEGITLYLYRVAMNVTRRNLPPRVLPDGRRLRPPLPVDLYYMLTPWARDAEKQHDLLGWAMRVLEDTPILPANYLNQFRANTFNPNETVELVADPLSVSDTNSIWNGFKPNQYPSVAYVARLILLESTVLMDQFDPVQTREFQLAKP